MFIQSFGNKIMKDSLQNENSFIFDRSWQTINPNQEQLISLEQARQFLLLLFQQHHQLRKLKESDLKQLDLQQSSQRIQSFILKFIQQKEVAHTSRRELPHINKSTYKLSLNDCLQVWRWLSQDSSSFKQKYSSFEDQMSMNEFDLEKNNDNLEIKRPLQISSNSKKVFNQLSLQEQQIVLKKSLQMVYMYYHQFKIIFNHYCKFIIENEHKRTFTFDDVSHSLEVLSVNRFMLFCRQFDIIKTIQFKRKNEQKSSISKDMLTKIFKKNSYLQKYMNLDNFLISLINIALKLHQNFDPRSYMHIELFLNSLKVKYYQQFVRKLQYLKIKYSPTQFYNCYKHIFNNHKLLKKKKDNYSSVFNNPYFTNQNDKNSNDNPQSLSNYTKQPSLHGKNMRSSKSVQSLLIQKPENHSVINFKASKTLQKRKISVPILPTIENNRFFKPLEHNNHLNNYQKYLQKVDDTTSVFKNRITGYSQVNTLKSKAFHMKQDNELPLSKNDFELMLEKKKEDTGKQISIVSSSNLEKSIIDSYQSQRIVEPLKLQSQLEPIFRQYEQSSEKKEIVEGLKQKINVREDDQLLNKHLIAEKLLQDPNKRINQALARQLSIK